jgi:hypothetical protein
VGNQPSGGVGGYWLDDAKGGIYSFGDASFYGSTGNIALNKPIVGMAATPDGGGYWLVASDGGIFTFGNAPSRGARATWCSTSPSSAWRRPRWDGYWLVASDGGVFTFGDAHFYGSTGNMVLNKPIVGMAPTPDGGGYWLVASDGGIFTFGDAAFYGSLGGIGHRRRPWWAWRWPPTGAATGSSRRTGPSRPSANAPAAAPGADSPPSPRRRAP